MAKYSGRSGFIALVGFLLFSSTLYADVFTVSSGIRQPLSNEHHTGFNDQVTREAFRRIGVKADIIKLPPKRALRDLNNGVTDADLVRIKNIHNVFPNIYVVPEKIIDFEFVAVSKNKNYKPIDSWASLKPYEVGIVDGWKILETNVTGTVSRTKVQDTIQLVNLLQKDRVDLIVSERWQVLYAIKQQKSNNLYINEPSIKTQSMYLVVNEKHKKLIPKLTQALKDMKKDGFIKKTYKNTLSILLK